MFNVWLTAAADDLGLFRHNFYMSLITFIHVCCCFCFLNVNFCFLTLFHHNIVKIDLLSVWYLTSKKYTWLYNPRPSTKEASTNRRRRQRIRTEMRLLKITRIYSFFTSIARVLIQSEVIYNIRNRV